MDLLDIVHNRYTTKAYDPTKRISQEQFERFLEILRYTPSSINIQPWHFFIADHESAKQRIAKALVGKYSYNAPKVLDSSHTILFCTKADITEEHLEHLLNQDTASGRFKDETAKQGQKDSRSGYVDYYRNEKVMSSVGLKIRLLLLLGKCYWQQVLKVWTLPLLVDLMKILSVQN